MRDPKFKQPLEDEKLVCVDCGVSFVFSADEQVYFQQRSLSPRKRCPACAKLRRDRISRQGGVR